MYQYLVIIQSCTLDLYMYVYVWMILIKTLKYCIKHGLWRDIVDLIQYGYSCFYLQHVNVYNSFTTNISMNLSNISLKKVWKKKSYCQYTYSSWIPYYCLRNKPILLDVSCLFIIKVLMDYGKNLNTVFY